MILASQCNSSKALSDDVVTNTGRNRKANYNDFIGPPVAVWLSIFIMRSLPAYFGLGKSLIIGFSQCWLPTGFLERHIVLLGFLEPSLTASAGNGHMFNLAVGPTFLSMSLS